ncbi:divergent PAP2 family protein [Alkalibacillus silvisoli]|uniref:Divergent PAP2 family protein n=1 Tax=Alkalibacillus silvisoli TaxID=392823 RepID=A0ABP3JK54_9BACI
MNRGIITALSAIGIAQGLKIFTHRRVSGSWDMKQASTSGGMPSSHSAGVSALTSYLAVSRGSRHTETALATIFGIIVMYDAQGIRRHTGEIAQIVNDLEDHFEELSGNYPSFQFVKKDKELEEVLGHQPIEVFGGALLGSLIGLISANLEKK